MKLYLDEDISPRVAEFLRKKGTDAVSAHEIQMIGASDEQQLARAASEGRAMVTRNRNDFVALTVRFFQDIRPHCGVLIVPHSLPGHDFSRLANRLHDYAIEHPDGMQPYTIAFISK
ncbi:MAG: DUF5615 family PIN-like protein [Desulfobacterales bacterium]|nr:DUF5615 family PIN-like protein [Desulfobacterales bacterium]